MKTRTLLLYAFGALAALVLVTALLGLRTAASSNDAFDNYVHGPAERMALANKVLIAANARAIAARNMVLSADQQRLEVEKVAVSKAHGEVQSQLAELKKRVAEAADSKAKELLDAIVAVEAKYGPVALDIVAKAAGGERDAAIAKMNAECQPLLTALLAAGDAYLAYGAQRGHQLTEEAQDSYAIARMVLIGALLLALATAVGLGAFIPRHLMRALGAEPDQLGSAARKIAQGDLGPIAIESHGL